MGDQPFQFAQNCPGFRTGALRPGEPPRSGQVGTVGHPTWVLLQTCRRRTHEGSGLGVCILIRFQQGRWCTLELRNRSRKPQVPAEPMLSRSCARHSFCINLEPNTIIVYLDRVFASPSTARPSREEALPRSLLNSQFPALCLARSRRSKHTGGIIRYKQIFMVGNVTQTCFPRTFPKFWDGLD